jgi:hypothetical protein
MGERGNVQGTQSLLDRVDAAGVGERCLCGYWFSRSRGWGGGGGEEGTKGHGETKHREKEGEEKTQSASIVGKTRMIWYQPAQLLPTWTFVIRFRA